MKKAGMILVVLCVGAGVSKAALSTSTVDYLEDKSLMDDGAVTGWFIAGWDNIFGDPVHSDGYNTQLQGTYTEAVWRYDAAAGKEFSEVTISYMLHTNVTDAGRWGAVYILDQNWAYQTADTTWNDGATGTYRWHKDTYVLDSGVTSILVRKAVGSADDNWALRVGTVDMTVVPEPATIALLMLGSFGVIYKKRSR